MAHPMNCGCQRLATFQHINSSGARFKTHLSLSGRTSRGFILWLGILFSSLGLYYHDRHDNHLHHFTERSIFNLAILDDCYFVLLVDKGYLSFHVGQQIMVSSDPNGTNWMKASKTSPLETPSWHLSNKTLPTGTNISAFHTQREQFSSIYPTMLIYRTFLTNPRAKHHAITM